MTANVWQALRQAWAPASRGYISCGGGRDAKPLVAEPSQVRGGAGALALASLLACTSRVDDPPGPAYDSWDEACTIWEWIASRTMEATDEVAIAQLVTDLRAKCDFYEHVAPPECTEIVWDLLACQEPLLRPYTCCSAGAPCEAEFEAAQFEPGDPCAPP